MHFRHILLALLVVAVWGFNFVVIKIGMKEVSPLILCTARFFLASLPAVFFIKRPNAPFKLIMLYGFIMFALQFALLFSGMYAGTTAGLASLLLQTHVFFTVALAMFFLKEKPTRWQIIGALVSFTGIAIVVMNLGGDITLTGLALIIAAAASWGVGNLISKKLGKVNMVALVVWGSLIAWPPLLVVSFVLEGTNQILNSFHHITWLSIAAITYIVYPTTLFGFAVWSWLLNQYPAATIAPFTLLVPVFGMFSSALVLGEPLQVWKLCAGLLVILGLCINLFGPRWMVTSKSKRAVQLG